MSAALWQTANRIQADRIDIDRDKKILVAAGNVVSEFMDQDNQDDKDDTPESTPSHIVASGAQAIPVVAKPEAGDPLKGIAPNAPEKL